jgi:SRSO17 transposase
MQKCIQYLCGLLLEGNRKSIGAMVPRIGVADAQALQQFIADAPWQYKALQLALVDFMQAQLDTRAKGSTLILDDTSFPKQGKESVGVARQYCGALGKIANCQAMVSWHYAEGGMRRLHFPLVSQLYLPKEWTSNLDRLKKTKVPESKWKFNEKWRIALQLLDLIGPVVPHEACIFDSKYGEMRPFLAHLDSIGEEFIAQIPYNNTFWPANVPTSNNDDGKRSRRPRKYLRVTSRKTKLLSAEGWYQKLKTEKKYWRGIILPDQRRKKVLVAAVRVRERVRRERYKLGPERWLLIERHSDETITYYLSSFPADFSIRRIIHLAHNRYKVEQGYQYLKEELGMDQYEGRTWIGFHHHVTLCFMAYNFLVLMQKDTDLKKKIQSEKFIRKFIASNAA